MECAHSAVTPNISAKLFEQGSQSEVSSSKEIEFDWQILSSVHSFNTTILLERCRIKRE